MIYVLGERRIATTGDDYFVAPSADVIGTVRLGRWASVWLVMGSPAQVVREATDRDRQLLVGAAAHYRENAQRYRRQLAPL